LNEDEIKINQNQKNNNENHLKQHEQTRMRIEKERYEKQKKNAMENRGNCQNEIQNYFYGRVLFILYLIVKLFYVVNCFVQFLILNKFIAGEYKGSEVI
jgi:hypothetical protein